MNEAGTSPRSSGTATARAQIELLRIAEGFFGSRVLFALAKLRIFETVGGAELHYEEIARRTGAEANALLRLLRAGVMLGLLESPDGTTFRVAAGVAPLLGATDADGFMGHWVGFLDYLNDALDDLAQVATAGQPAAALLDLKDRRDLRTFTLAMHDYAALRGRELCDHLDTGGCTTLLDVGCGPATYAFQLALRNPELALYLADLPEVLEIAREVQLRYELRNDVHYIEVDLEHEHIAGTYDLVLVSNLLHMLGESGSRRLVSRLHGTVVAGGSIVVQAQFLDDDRMGGRWPILMDLAQLCVTRDGRNHTVGETRSWLEEAGFTDIQFCAMSAFNTNGFLRAWKRA